MFDIARGFYTIFIFLFGVTIGIIFVLLFYLLIVVISMDDSLKVHTSEDVDKREIEDLVLKAQYEFTNKDKVKKLGSFRYMSDIVTKLTLEISRKFYPNSKYPLLELTIDEVIHLNEYILLRLDELFSKRGLRIFRRLKISTIYHVTTTTKNIYDSNAAKYAREKELNKKRRMIVGALNIINPFYWVRSFVVNKSFDIIVSKVCLATIAIVGEETYKVYSKKVFDKSADLDTNVDDIESSIKEDIIGE